LAQSPKKAEMIDELLNLARDTIAGELAGQVTAEQAERMAETMVEKFLETWGGISVYLPRPDALRRMRRNREIAQNFHGTDAGAIRLAREHGLTTISVYRICAQQRAQRREAIA